MFLDPSDFEDVPYAIPNQEESRSLQDFIDAKEAEYLKKVLGLSLYNDFLSGLETSGEIEDIWINLRDGIDYTYNDTIYNYCGVKELLKPVIYSDWIAVNYRKWSNGGMIVNNGQNNSTSVNPIDEIVSSWNEFINRAGGSCYRHFKRGWYNTLNGYLDANAEDYTSWNASNTYPLQYRNTLDL